MHNFFTKRAAAAGLTALIAAATATAAVAGGHGNGGGAGGAAPGGKARVESREQIRSEYAEQVQQGMPGGTGLMSLEQLQVRLRAEGYGEISEFEREGLRYEVSARNQAGVPIKLHLDARSGAILGVEQDD